jgi:alanine racemase
MMVTSLVELTVDLAALRHNYLQLRRRLSADAKLLAVVKADAYGHGLVPAARTLAAAGAEYLGVASLEEGLALRAAGLRLPIVLLMGIVPPER